MTPLFCAGDYVSPGLQAIKLDSAFPNMIIGNKDALDWEYLRREVPHNWYVDQRAPYCGFLNRDEVLILYNNALKFKGKRALEIGCWLGWSACHLIAAGVLLDGVDPVLQNPQAMQSVKQSLDATAQIVGLSASPRLIGSHSPAAVEGLAAVAEQRWSLIFIDGDHRDPQPLDDAVVCARYAAFDSMIVFHDLAAPDVAVGLRYLKERGWKTMIYQTMQIMGVAWRGDVEPIAHQPDPSVAWTLPDHLTEFEVCHSAAARHS